MLEPLLRGSPFDGTTLGSLWMEAASWLNTHTKLEQKVISIFTCRDLRIYGFVEPVWRHLKALTCVRSRAGEHRQDPATVVGWTAQSSYGCSTAPAPAESSGRRRRGKSREEEHIGRDHTVQPGCPLQDPHCVPRVPIQGWVLCSELAISNRIWIRNILKRRIKYYN